MSVKDKFVFALYIATSVAVVAHAATEIYVTFKSDRDFDKIRKESDKNV